jgi:putative MATE family efflux protein
MLQSAISMGLGVGAAAVIARAIGENDSQKVRRLTTDALILSVSLVIVVIIIGLLTIDPLFSFLGAGDALLVLIRRYMSIWYLGVPFVVIPMVGNNAIRAAGNTVVPSVVMLIAIALNLVLDPLLIFGYGPFPRLELEGAALATIISRSVTFVVALLFLHFKFGMLTSKFAGFRQTLESWKKVLFVGIPAAFTQLLIPLAIGFVTRLLAGQGQEAIAAFGVCSRIEMFAFSPITALGAVMTPFTGQNFGAQKWQRINQGVNFSLLFAMVFGALLWLVLAILGERFGRIFNQSPLVFTTVGRYMLIVGAACGLHGVSIIIASVFSALNKPFSATAVNFVKMIVLLIPLTYIGMLKWQVNGIFAGISAAYILTGIGSYIFLRTFLNRQLPASCNP